MPKSPGIDYVLEQKLLSVVAIRHKIESLQALEGQCRDPRERGRIHNDWNRLEVELDLHVTDTLGNLQRYRTVVDAWALDALKSEPSSGQLRLEAVELLETRERRPVRGAAAQQR